MPSNLQAVEYKQTSLADVLRVLYQKKWWLILLPLLTAVLFVFVVLEMPNRYKADTTLIPAAGTNSKMSGQLGSLAALAGVNIGGLAGSDKTDLAIEVMMSREFLQQFIERRDLLIPIMAAERYNYETGTLLIDVSIYDEAAKRWVRDAKPPLSAKPSLQEAHKEFLLSFGVSKDKAKNTIFVSYEHVSPEFARNVVNWIVEDINEYMRQADIEDANKSIHYLQQEADKSTVTELRNVIYALLEEQLKTLMIANVRQEYVFKVIDKAVIPEEKSGPKRAVILILIYLSMLIFTAACVIMAAQFKTLKTGNTL